MQPLSQHGELLDGLVAFAYAGECHSEWRPDREQIACERSQVDALCDEIQHLACSALGPEKIFQRFIEKSARIYRAKQVAIWLWDEAGEIPVLSAVGYHEDLRRPDQGSADGFLEFVRTCFQSGQPRLQRWSSPCLRGSDASAGDLALEDLALLQPICLNGKTVGVIAIDLGSDRPGDDDTATGYLAVAKHLGECLSGYLRNRQRRADEQFPSFAEATRALQTTGDWIVSRREAIRQMIEEDLGLFAGLRFKTLQENREFAVMVHELLDANGFRSQCPECGEAAILRCLNTGNSKTGVFSFDHYVDGRRKYHCGATSFPKLKIRNKPRRRQRNSSPTD